jgi:hypothetical protein
MVHDGGAHTCTRGTSTLGDQCKGATTLPDLIHDQDGSPRERLVWWHARNDRLWASTCGVVVFGDGNQEIANAESVGEHGAWNESAPADGKNRIGVVLLWKCLNLNGKLLNEPVEFVP